MSTLEDEQIPNEREVEITDLDPPGTVHKVFGLHVIPGQRLSYRRRGLLLLLTIIGGVALLLLVLASIPPGARNTHPGGTSIVTHPTFVPRSLSLLDGVVYVVLPNGDVQAMRANDGTLLWRHKGILDPYPIDSSHGIVLLLEQQSGTVDALRVSDGTLLWHSKGFAGWSQSENGRVYVEDGNMAKALRASDGTIIWQQQFAGPGLWVVNDVVYGLPDIGSVGAFRASDGSPLWRHKIDGLILGIDNRMIYLDLWDHSVAALRISDGSLLWQQKAVQADTLSARTDGALYFLSQNGELDAVRTTDGAIIWHKQLPTALLGGTYVDADDQVVYLTYPNNMRDFLRASDGSLLWNSPHLTNESDFGPVADHGVIYFRILDGVDARRVINGTLLWHRRVGGNILWIENGIIYFSTDNGGISALRGSDGKLLWQRVVSVSGVSLNKTPSRT